MWRFWLTSGLAFGASFLGKLVMESVLVLDHWNLLPGYLEFRLSLNPGIAFGLSTVLWLQWLLILLALLMMFILSMKSREPLSQIAFGAITGGALANVLDRLIDGVVTDFVAVGNFPVFNIADTCITGGILLLLLKEFWPSKSRKGRRPHETLCPKV